jgi:hypothetical protein
MLFNIHNLLQKFTGFYSSSFFGQKEDMAKIFVGWLSRIPSSEFKLPYFMNGGHHYEMPAVSV